MSDMGMMIQHPVRVDRFTKILELKGEVKRLKDENASLRKEKTTFDRRISELVSLVEELQAAKSAAQKQETVSATAARPEPYRPGARMLTINDIIFATSDFYQIPFEDIVGPEMRRDVTLSRHIAMYLAHKHTKYSATTISKALGRCDHTTSTNGRDRVAFFLQTDTEIARAVEQIERQLGLCQ